MALAKIDAVCRECRGRFRAQPKRTFLGFQRLVCPHCSRRVLYPLTTGYRATYWVFVGFMGLVIVTSLATGTIAFPGLIGLAMIWALDKDRRIRKVVLAAQTSGSAT
ncbi:MAG: hypothetical protein ACRDFW_06110 [bacterium]